MHTVRLVLSLCSLVILAACSTTPVDLYYHSPPTAAAADAHPVVAVGSFTDQRKHDPNWLGAIRGGYGNPLKTLQTPVPVSEVARKAFIDGLSARGLYAEQGNAPYTLKVDVRQFDCNQFVRREAHVDLLLTLTETATGKTIVTEPVKRDVVNGSLLAFDTGIFASVEDLRAIARQALQDAVDAGLDGVEFKQALR